MGDVSEWICGIREGRGDAQRRLWECYFPRVLALAENKLGHVGGMADAEDVAASVLDSLLQGARAGRFSRLSNRNDLWSLLFAITQQKAVSLLRYHRAKKRSAGAGQVGLDELPADEPSPEFAALFEDLVRGLFDRLESVELCRIARLRLEGWTNLEIADQLGVAVRTVERKLRLIEKIWSRGFEH
jgi:DNA-directed RNA polymerase specialized sigma24 family protein